MRIKCKLNYTIVIIERGSLKLVITPGEEDELGEALATVIDTLDSNAEWKALYKQVFGRWRKIALTTAESKSFWIVNKLMLPSLAIETKPGSGERRQAGSPDTQVVGDPGRLAAVTEKETPTASSSRRGRRTARTCPKWTRR